MEREKIFSVCKAFGFKTYEASYRDLDGCAFLMVRHALQNVLLIFGDAPKDFSGEVIQIGDRQATACSLTAGNAAALRRLFPYTAPISPRGHGATIGLGDRLGLVTGAHIQALKGCDVFPVLAQQSKRELALAGRTNRSMLDDVTWQVFESGYEGGYAADGDHLKTLAEVQAAIADGNTMITLDCSEYIDNAAVNLSPAEAEKRCREVFSSELLHEWDWAYAEKCIPLDEHHEIRFSRESLYSIYLIYGETLHFIKMVYQQVIQASPVHVALEISIDETETETTPEAHYFVAAELLRQGVFFESMAPRFCGEFQKGVDYIGDIRKFQTDFAIHALVAKKLGYRISVHSGSDKFSIFPFVGQLSENRFHLKTSGTSWVEAVRVIAQCNPSLFRRMLTFSCARYQEAKAFYHVSGLVEKIPPVNDLADEDLPTLLDTIDARQVIHITYGFLLREKTPDGAYAFRDDIYQTLAMHKKELDQGITDHIRRHLTCLGLFPAEGSEQIC